MSKKLWAWGGLHEQHSDLPGHTLPAGLCHGGYLEEKPEKLWDCKELGLSSLRRDCREPPMVLGVLELEAPDFLGLKNFYSFHL